MIEKPTNFIAKPRLVKTKAYGLVSTLALVGMGMASPVYANETATTPTEAVVTTVATELNDTAEIQVDPQVTTEFIAIDAPVEGEVAPFENIEPYKVSSEAANAGAKYSEEEHPLLLVESVPTDNAVTTEPTTDVAVEESKNPTVFDKNLEDLEKGSSLVIDNGYTHFSKERPVTPAFEVSVDHDKDIVLDKEETERLAKEKGFSTVRYEDGKTVYVADKELLDTVNKTVNIPQAATGSLSFDALVSLKREIVEKEVLVPHVEYDPITKTREILVLKNQDGIKSLVKESDEYTDFLERDASYTIKHFGEVTSEVFDPLQISVHSSNPEGTLEKLSIVAPSGKKHEILVNNGYAVFTPQEKGSHRIDYAISSTGAKAVDFTVSISGSSSTGETVDGKIVGKKTVTRKVIKPIKVEKTREIIEFVEKTRMEGYAEERLVDVEKIRIENREETYTEPETRTRKEKRIVLEDGKETRTRIGEREESYEVTEEVTEMVDKEVTENETVTKSRKVPKTIEVTSNEEKAPIYVSYVFDMPGSRDDYPTLDDDKPVINGYNSVISEFDKNNEHIKGSKIFYSLSAFSKGGSLKVNGFEGTSAVTVKDTATEYLNALFSDSPANAEKVLFLESDFSGYKADGSVLYDSQFSLKEIQEAAKDLGITVYYFLDVDNYETKEESPAYKYLSSQGADVTIYSYFGRKDFLNEKLTAVKQKVSKKTIEVEEPYTETVPVTKTIKVPLTVSKTFTKTRIVPYPESYEVSVKVPKEIEVDSEYIVPVTKTRTVKVPVFYVAQEWRTFLAEKPVTYTEPVKRIQKYTDIEYRLVDEEFEIDDRNVSEHATSSLKQSQEFKELNIENPDLYLAELPESGKAYTFVTSTKIKDDKGNGYATSKQVMVKTKPEVKEVVVEPKIEEPKKEEPQEVPSLEMKKTTAPEVAKKTENLQQVAAVVQMPQASVDGPKPTLPNTGESQSAIAVTGMTLLAAALGMTYSRKRA